MNYQKIIPLIARAFLAIIFIQSGISKIFNFAGTQETIAGVGLPFPAVALVITILVEVAGGLMVLLGAKARLGALLLVLFLILATILFHNPIADSSQVTQFLKNLAIMGGLLMVFAYGPGLISLETSSDSAKLSQ
ncbi:MAG: DoxX family protein [Elainellaceae cyanobacterium]